MHCPPRQKPVDRGAIIDLGVPNRGLAGRFAEHLKRVFDAT